MKEMSVPLNKDVLFFDLFTPPAGTNSSGISSYCILGEEDVEYYYVFYLRIE